MPRKTILVIKQPNRKERRARAREVADRLLDAKSCVVCNGTGRMLVHKCFICGGTGKVRRNG